MKRAMCVVPAAVAIVAAGAVSVAHASPAAHPATHPVAEVVSHRMSPSS